jgi:hypothetical protein
LLKLGVNRLTPEEIKALPTLEHGTKLSSLSKIFGLEDGGLKPGYVLEGDEGRNCLFLTPEERNADANRRDEYNNESREKRPGFRKDNQVDVTLYVDNVQLAWYAGADLYATQLAAVVTEKNIPPCFVDRAADIKTGRQIYQRVHQWPVGSPLPVLDTVRCVCGRVQPAGFETCLCNSRGGLSHYREVNLNANPSGAAAFKADTQKDVGGSYVERVKSVIKGITGWGSMVEARRSVSNPWTNLWDSARRRNKQAAKELKANLPIPDPGFRPYPEGAGSIPVDVAPLRAWSELMKNGLMTDVAGTLEII